MLVYVFALTLRRYTECRYYRLILLEVLMYPIMETEKRNGISTTRTTPDDGLVEEGNMSLRKIWDSQLRSDGADQVLKELVRPVMHIENLHLSLMRIRHRAVGHYNRRTRCQDHNQVKNAYSDMGSSHSSSAVGREYSSLCHSIERAGVVTGLELWPSSDGDGRDRNSRRRSMKAVSGTR
jgi:hypothetical protein